MLPNDELVEAEKAGKILIDFEANGVLKTIEAWILNPLEVQAFEAFGNVKPDDTNAIMEVQVKKKAVQMFRSQWKRIVDNGKIATAELSGKLTGEEDIY